MFDDECLGFLDQREQAEIRHEIHKLVISIWNEKELPVEWDESFILLFYKRGVKNL